jgi:hypothetical protein
MWVYFFLRAPNLCCTFHTPMETPTVRRREDVIRVRPVFAFPGLFSQNFFLDTRGCAAKMNTPTLQELNVGVFFSQGTQPALHLSHSDGNANLAPP